jgi:hypothetical protein
MEKEGSDQSHRFELGDTENWLKYLEDYGYVVIKQV